MGNDYVLLTVDRDLDGGKGFKAPKVADDDMTVAAGDVCTTVRRSPNSPTTYYYWSELEYYDVKIIDDAHCKELFMERYTDDFICVGPNDSTAEYPNDQCQTENGAPLVCADKLFAIATCGKNNKFEANCPTYLIYFYLFCRVVLLRISLRLQENFFLTRTNWSIKIVVLQPKRFDNQIILQLL